MFDRSAGYTQQQKPVPVQLRLADGQAIKGRLLPPHGTTIVEFLNSQGTAFFEFKTYDGQTLYLARNNVISIEILGLPKADQLARQQEISDTFDPFEVLGLPDTADNLAIRTAYRELAKSYHPDKYAGIDGLPKEIKDYVSAMFQRINGAYSALESLTATPDSDPETDPGPNRNTSETAA